MQDVAAWSSVNTSNKIALAAHADHAIVSCFAPRARTRQCGAAAPTLLVLELENVCIGSLRWILRHSGLTAWRDIAKSLRIINCCGRRDLAPSHSKAPLSCALRAAPLSSLQLASPSAKPVSNIASI